MLTIEMLQKNAILAGLTSEQMNAIAEMSQNDENNVIGSKIGALHGQYDADILAITGISKNSGEKSYEYAKRVIADYKQKAESVKAIETELANQKNKVVELNAKLASGSQDEQLKQQLKDSQALVSQLTQQLQAKSAELDTTKADYEKKLSDTHIDYAFSAATAGLNFKPGIADSLKPILIASAKTEVLSKGKPEFITDVLTGKTSLIFRDENGNILNNPSNNLKPYTVEELLMQTTIKDAIDSGKQLPGAGTKNTNPTAGSGDAFDISGIKSQVEADKAIEAHLLSRGLTRESLEFSDELQKIRTENNVDKLPIR